MKKEIRDRWVTALRSGEYEQGRHDLRRGDEFCCLGVLCDVMNIDVPERGQADAYDAVTRLLAAAKVGTLGKLVSMNDDDRTPFAGIADYIEQHIPVEES
jgi:hypothetical protein